MRYFVIVLALLSLAVTACVQSSVTGPDCHARASTTASGGGGGAGSATGGGEGAPGSASADADSGCSGAKASSE